MSATSSPRKFSIFHTSEVKKSRRASAQSSTALCPDDVGGTAPLRTILRNYAAPTLSSTLRSKMLPAKADRRSLPSELSPSTSQSSQGIVEELPPIYTEKDTPVIFTPPSAPAPIELAPIELIPIESAPIEPARHCQYDSGKALINPQACLLGIPLELRLMIFKHVFPPGKPRGSAEITLYCAPALRVLGSSNAQLSRVNWQIYEETKELLYGQTFVFLSCDAMMKFSATRTPHQMSSLRAIRMNPRVTNWSGAIKSLVLPPAASLTLHWHITQSLWDALMANVTLDYREVTLLPGHDEQLVVFEALQNTRSTEFPSYKHIEMIFSR